MNRYLVTIALFAGGLTIDNQMEAASKRFVAAPICAGSDVDSMTCRLNAPMMVTDKWNMPGHGLYLQLLARSGETYQAQFRRSNHLWEAVSPGEVVEAQVWQRGVVFVSVGPHWSRTRAYPGPTSQSVHHVFGTVTGLLLLLALGFLWLLSEEQAGVSDLPIRSLLLHAQEPRSKEPRP